jgi:DNA repair exonuclease SbcCD ATPase subunit
MFLSPKVAVLESKLDIYEDLSREMLSKLESAVEKISEGNNQIATILAKHESRLDESNKSDQAIIELVKRVENNLDELEDKFEKLQKIVWVISISAGIIITALQILPTLGFKLTPVQPTAKIQGVKTFVNGSN